MYSYIKVTGASKIAQKVKVPATRPADLSVIPGPTWQKRTDSHKWCDLHMRAMAHAYAHSDLHMHTK